MEKKEIVRTGYNKVAERIQEISGLEKEGSEELNLLANFTSRIPLGGLILDAGCGYGVYSRYLSEKFKVIGVDISEKQIKLAKQNAPKAEFICEDITKTNFPGESFAGILAFYSIIHVPREEHYDLLSNFFRMLKMNGVVLLVFQANDDPESYENNFFSRGVKMYWSGFDEKANLNMLKQIGFRIIWSKSVKESPKWGESSHLYVFAEK
ncbi:MAG: class I SAM-dependent methyltransferase [Candidatus Lokiarchaeota archaeon]|nr:class I SAM-dependent methyltransferase [Candidatus Lokiarchaeota archaeon]